MDLLATNIEAKRFPFLLGCVDLHNFARQSKIYFYLRLFVKSFYLSVLLGQGGSSQNQIRTGVLVS